MILLFHTYEFCTGNLDDLLYTHDTWGHLHGLRMLPEMSEMTPAMSCDDNLRCGVGPRSY